MLICRKCFKIHNLEHLPDTGICNFCEGALCEISEIQKEIPSITKEIIELLKKFIEKTKQNEIPVVDFTKPYKTFN